MLQTTDDLRINSLRPLISPAILIEELPLTNTAAHTITQARRSAEAIVQGKDERLLVIVGPCSIHDPQAALDYGSLLKQAAEKHKDDLCIIMRVYFEKPRTTVGWKGLINDPSLNGDFNINQGLRVARDLLIELSDQGVPCGTEFLDTIIPQFISDVVAWGAIGARTTESQIHRELTSGLSMPVGFKNGTDGNMQIACDAIKSAQHPHHFLSVTKHGIPAIVSTSGNDACHMILRGGKNETNYDSASILRAVNMLNNGGIKQGVMIDCSHGNSKKDHRRQAEVTQSVCEQVSAGNESICGVMLESNLVSGKQDLTSDEPLVYGKSITDACISWDETQGLLEQLAQATQQRRQQQWSKSA